MEIGHRIAHARNGIGMTQREFAKEVGVTNGLVGQWESHVKKPGRDNLAKIAEIAMVSMEWLQTGKEDPGAGVYVRDPDAIKMLRSFMRMSPRQRKNAAELFDVAADVRREVEKQTAPSETESPVG